MRHATLLAIPTAIISIATAFQLPNLEPFLAALPISLSDYIPDSLTNQTAHHDLLKRQYSNTCPTNFNSCTNLGAPGLCCAAAAVCSADAAGNVACCPSGAACSGTIGGYITAGTVNSDGALVGVATTGSDTSGLVGASASSTTSFQAASTTSSGGLILASTQATTATTDESTATGSAFVLDGGSTVATPGAGMRAAQIVSGWTISTHCYEIY